ncbi:MAG: hypothetical protein WD448_10815 [Woeseia sp.]
MSEQQTQLKERVAEELIRFAGLAGVSLLILPLAIYLVGRVVFGDYGGGGLFDFYAQLLRDFLNGEPAVWFLLLSPYLVWQIARLAAWGFRRRNDSPTPAA